MTYSSGGLIQAADYNTFVAGGGAGVNGFWNSAWGQTALANVSSGTTVSATNWSTLVTVLASSGAHTNTAITARSSPVATNIISVLANVATDITNITTNKYNAVATGPQYIAWTGTNSKTTATSGTPWSITFVNTVSFASAAAANAFFGAGGLVKIDVSKTSTGDVGDPEWNDLANTLCGDIYISSTGSAHTIAGTAYTGTTKIGGSGTPDTLATTTGWLALSAGAAATVVYKQFADTAPYTSNYIQHSIAKSADSTQLTITTVWYAADGDPITGGTAASGATPGTAPCTIVTYFPPETQNITDVWGTPTVAATTA